MTCTATYTVIQADVGAGLIRNTASVTGVRPGGLPPPTDEDTATFPPVPPVPALPPLAVLLLVAALSALAMASLRRVRA